MNTSFLNRIPWVIVSILSLIIGLYPVIYFLIERNFGLLGNKSPELLENLVWNAGFYGHIVLGGLALLSGWSQFSSGIRKRRVKTHRFLGKVYVFSVLISGICGLFISFYATGGVFASAGFFTLAVIWLFTTWMAYRSALNKQFNRHEYFMYFSFAACFAAVTLRIWLPLLMGVFEDFVFSYRIVAWLCWVPNLVVAYFLVKKKNLAPFHS